MGCFWHGRTPLKPYSRSLASNCMRAASSVVPRRRRRIAKSQRALRRKNMLMDQRKLTAAKTALGAATETAAVDAALDLVVFRAEVFHGLEVLAAAGGLGTVDPRRRIG